MKKDLDEIIITEKLSEPKLERLIKKYPGKVNWDYISAYQRLSQSFIEKYKNKVNWELISSYQRISEKFLEKFKGRIQHWYYICRKRKLSPEFIIRNTDKITKDIFENKHYESYPDEIKMLLRLKIK